MKTRPIAKRIMDALARHHPNPDTELHFRTPFELLVATILSAQSSDERVNQVTPSLFEQYPDVHAFANAEPSDLEPVIKSTGFFRQKSKALSGMAKALVEHHRGVVPADMDALTKLPGVGRKTANVVLGHALGVPGLPVDRHVLRVANRIGLVQSDDPEKVEQGLGALYPPARWTQVSDLLILHGRRICRPTPKCEICNVRKDCDFFLSGGVIVRAGRAKARATAGPQGRSKDGPLRTRGSPRRVEDSTPAPAIAVRRGRSLDRPSDRSLDRPQPPTAVRRGRSLDRPKSK